MFFLCNRYKQLEDIQKHYLNAGKPVVSDYHIFKNTIFAKRTLKEEQYEKYRKVYDILTEGHPKPNVLIYLTASLDTLIERIQLRGREVEQNIQASYLEQIRQDYEDFMIEFEQNHPDIPVIRLDGDKLDFVKNNSDLDEILSIVEKHIFKGEVIS